MQDYDPNKFICPTEKEKFSFIWYVWGPENKSLNIYKSRFGKANADLHFYLDSDMGRVVCNMPRAKDKAKHTQGMSHDDIVPFISKLIKRNTQVEPKEINRPNTIGRRKVILDFPEYLREIKGLSESSVKDDMSRINMMLARNIDYTKGEDYARGPLLDSGLSKSTITSCLRVCRYYKEYLDQME